MELKSISSFLENKTILVTGSTGFLAKILVEKILNVQPNVKRIYLIFRATDDKSALQRLHSEVIGKELFRVLKERWGNEFDSLISEKLVPIPGDISVENLGIKDSNLREEIWKHIDIIVNSAATTNFYERYDVSLAINTMGAMHVLGFAKKCSNLKMLLHVSTAYVCGEQEGLIPEKAFQMGDTINATSLKLDIDEENKLVAHKLKKLKAQNVPQQDISAALKSFGVERAKLFGWPNTYSFTKAMGEMCLGQYLQHHNLPIVIIRPTIISSTYKDPFPGWMEGLKTMDSVIAGYGKGKVTSFFANPTLKLDLIPADMVVNAMIVGMVAHANECSSSVMIYQVGSSLRNPTHFSALHNYSHRYFTENPLTNKEGRPIQIGKVTMWNSMSAFTMYMTIRFGLPLKLLQWLNIALLGSLQEMYISNERKFRLVMQLVEIYKPYLMFNGIFDDTNTERLRLKAKASFMEANAFNFNPKCIDWEDYIINFHIPGLIKYVLK